MTDRQRELRTSPVVGIGGLAKRNERKCTEAQEYQATRYHKFKKDGGMKLVKKDIPGETLLWFIT